MTPAERDRLLRIWSPLFAFALYVLGFSALALSQADFLPTLPDAACDGRNVSGSTVTVAGVTGALRGQSQTLATGEVIRPELVILDDPQTRESAMSPSQSAERVAII